MSFTCSYLWNGILIGRSRRLKHCRNGGERSQRWGNIYAAWHTRPLLTPAALQCKKKTTTTTKKPTCFCPSKLSKQWGLCLPQKWPKGKKYGGGGWAAGRGGGCHFSGVLCEAILARMPWSQLCTARTGKCLLATWLRSSGQYLEPIFDTYDAEHTASKVKPSLNVLRSAAPPRWSVKKATGGVGGFSQETCVIMNFYELLHFDSFYLSEKVGVNVVYFIPDSSGAASHHWLSPNIWQISGYTWSSVTSTRKTLGLSWEVLYISEVSEKTLDTDISLETRTVVGENTGIVDFAQYELLQHWSQCRNYPKKKKKKSASKFLSLQVVASCFQTRVQTQKSSFAKGIQHISKPAASIFMSVQKKNNCCHDFSRILDLLCKS